MITVPSLTVAPFPKKKEENKKLKMMIIIITGNCFVSVSLSGAALEEHPTVPVPEAEELLLGKFYLISVFSLLLLHKGQPLAYLSVCLSHH